MAIRALEAALDDAKWSLTEIAGAMVVGGTKVMQWMHGAANIPLGLLFADRVPVSVRMHIALAALRACVARDRRTTEQMATSTGRAAALAAAEIFAIMDDREITADEKARALPLARALEQELVLLIAKMEGEP